MDLMEHSSSYTYIEKYIQYSRKSVIQTHWDQGEFGYVKCWGVSGG